VGGAVGIIQVKKLVLGFQMGEVLAGEDGCGAFADAAFGLWADDESFHGIPFGLKFIPAGGGLLPVGWRNGCVGTAGGNVAGPR